MARTSSLETHPLVTEPDGARGHQPAATVARASAGAARPALDRRLLASGLLGAAALVALVVGWFQVSATNDIYAQLPYFFSIGGTALALMLGAVALFVDYEHSCDRQGIALLLERLERVEELVGARERTTPPATGGSR